MSDVARVLVSTPQPVRVTVRSTDRVAVQQAGARGQRGEPGTSGGSYTHHQDVAEATWVIEHNLGYPPAITTYDSTGRWFAGVVTHPDPATTSHVDFGAPCAGVGVCS